MNKGSLANVGWFKGVSKDKVQGFGRSWVLNKLSVFGGWGLPKKRSVDAESLRA